ncbi:MAG: hypothetical protein O7G84_11690 [Gammaproteobacteria bacterium]|nr:hypothetical protein [Gammaproteobacteria bacterium]
MAEEVVEIELVSPAGSGEWVDEEAKAEKARDTKETAKKKTLEIELVAAFDAAARKRNAFALTGSQKKHRVERFEQALKAIAKRMSAQAANHVSDREARSEVRIQVYRGLMLLLNQLGRRQEASAASARRALKWSFGIATISILITTGTLIGSGIIPPPF